MAGSSRPCLGNPRSGNPCCAGPCSGNLCRDVRQHGRWARSSRAHAYYTADELESLFAEYMALLDKYGHLREDAPPGARPVQLRMFYIPDEAPQ